MHCFRTICREDDQEVRCEPDYPGPRGTSSLGYANPFAGGGYITAEDYGKILRGALRSVARVVGGGRTNAGA